VIWVLIGVAGAGAITLAGLALWPVSRRAGVLALFANWARIRLGIRLGPHLGFTTERLHEIDLSGAVPRVMPSGELLDQLPAACLSGSTPELRRANAWTAVLERVVRKEAPPRRWTPVATTYGFVQVDGGVRLSVIQYFRVLGAFRVPRPDPIEIDGHRFPVIVRPWLPNPQQGGQMPGVGTCWVEFVTPSGARAPGILTASHTLRPARPSVGARVTLDVARDEPGGLLRFDSQQMDAAVIEVGPDEWRGKSPVYPSRVLGFKPVRLLGAPGWIDADVVEHSGFVGGTIAGESRKEPLARTLLIFNRHLHHGDSGCLGLDLEFERDQEVPVTPPYLLYQGVYGTRSGPCGYGLMLEQTRIVWGLKYYG